MPKQITWVLKSEFAKIMGVGPSNVTRWIKEGKLKGCINSDGKINRDKAVKQVNRLLDPNYQKNPPGKQKLTNKQIAFVKEYMVDRNGKQAAIRAGYSKKTAKEIASRLLTKVNVKELVDAEQEKCNTRLELSADRTLLEIRRLATFDIRKLYKSDGKRIPIHELDDDTAACIKGVEIKKVGDTYISEYKFWAKEAALKMLADIQKLVKVDSDQNPAESVEIEFVTVSARKTVKEFA